MDSVVRGLGVKRAPRLSPMPSRLPATGGEGRQAPSDLPTTFLTPRHENRKPPSRASTRHLPKLNLRILIAGSCHAEFITFSAPLMP